MDGIERRSDGSPVNLITGDLHAKVLAGMGPNKTVGYAVRPLPSTHSGGPEELPERQYEVITYDFDTGQVITAADMARSWVIEYRDLLTAVLDDPLPDSPLST